MSNHRITLDLESDSGGGNSKGTLSADSPITTRSISEEPNNDDTPAVPGITGLADPVDDNLEIVCNQSGKVRTLDRAQQLEANLEQEMLMHRLAAAHFNALNNWIMVFPSIVLTLTTGICSFHASVNKTADMMKESTGQIGIIAIVSGFWQSLGKHFDFGRRHAQHSAAVVGLKKIKADFAFKKLAAKCIVDNDYCNRVNEQFTLATDEVESAVPGQISTAFSSIAAEINLHFVMAEKSDILPKTDLNREDLYLTAFVELYKVISRYRLFPLMLPDPDTSSSTAMEKLRIKLTCKSCA